MRRRQQRAQRTRAVSTPPHSNILFLAANPKSASHLELDEEARDIEQRLRAAQYRDSFAFTTRWAIRADDLQQTLLEQRPGIVHFSGHGTGANGILVTSATGDGATVPTAALRELFGIFRDSVRVVVLNACYSVEQATAIAEEVDIVIGMTGAIGDKAARIFAAAFYRGLGFGRSVREAFELGVNALDLEGLKRDGDLPVLHERSGIRADDVVLVREVEPPARPERSRRRVWIAAGAGALAAAIIAVAVLHAKGSSAPRAIQYEYLRLDHDRVATLLHDASGARGSPDSPISRLHIAAFATAAASPASIDSFRSVFAAAEPESVHEQQYVVLRVFNAGDRVIPKVVLETKELAAPVEIRDLQPGEAVGLFAGVTGRHADLLATQKLTYTSADETVDDRTETVRLPPLDELAFREIATGIWRGAPP